MKEKEEIIEYINSCDKCFASFKSNMKYPEIIFVKWIKIYNNIVALGVSKKDIKSFDNASNSNISVTIWNILKGYQLKGERILEDKEKNTYEVVKFRKDLKIDDDKNTEIELVLCDIKEIYHVTPGKFAGKLITIY
ncbi:hypothetical protein AN1V17_18300 [Vallitalea sediminicola]